MPSLGLALAAAPGRAATRSRHAARLASATAIQGLVIGNVARTHAVAHALHAQNLDVRPILSPTVPASSERLRICLHAFNTADEMRLLCQTLWTALSTEAQS